jgi:hypothetical protein
MSVILSSVFSEVTSIEPPSGENFIALVNKLLSTELISDDSSAITSMDGSTPLFSVIFLVENLELKTLWLKST